MDKLPHYPQGEVFELTLDGGAPENHPLVMVQDEPRAGEWKHSGPTIQGTPTQRFRWVAIGHRPTFADVRIMLKTCGKIPEGQWREAVARTFAPDGQHPRGIADASWIDPRGLPFFPFVDAYGGGSRVREAYGDFVVSWLWLIKVV
ncbi:hypothetical protein HYW17_03385 [Candidatus Uhrbacteria bacterium]|nr:hypothetical protein [Candidatus Uhrbacteria bacterium]